MKIQIKSVCSNVLFEFEKKGNTIKETLLKAIKSSANLRYADLRYANLRSANLLCVEGLEFKKIKPLFWILPEEGAFIAWKKLVNNYIAKIEIPEDAKRMCNVLNRKCRAEFVKTLAIWDKSGKTMETGINDTHRKKIEYTVGKITKADSFDDDFKVDCSNGIHFFLTRQEAEAWN